jgi:hypothetical protein
MNKKIPPVDFRQVYDNFDIPTTPLDCGKFCAPLNKTGKPFCCDICRAVPVAYRNEWDYLEGSTSLWHKWRGDECPQEPCDKMELLKETPHHLLLLACKGPAFCERDFRSVSCRQFPFFPYITSDFRFIGFTYDWEFLGTCWILSNLSKVTSGYRRQFIQTYDDLFSTWLEDLDSYAALSEETRDHYAATHRRFPLLHRNGRDYLVSPKNESLRQIKLAVLPKFGPYTNPIFDS